MNINSLKHCVLLGMVLVGVSLSLPAAAQSHTGGSGHGGGGLHGGGSGRGGSGLHGSGHGGGWHGGGGGGWHGDGPEWWGLGLGLSLGWEAEYFGNPYLYYPYPGYYYPYSPPTVIVEPSQGTTLVAPPNSPSASTWYYCDSAKGYYPYVTQCPEPWRMVPAVPPGSVR